MKKRDIYLIVILAILAVGALCFQMLNKETGDRVVITVNGSVYKEVPLNENTEISIDSKRGENKVKIENGGVSMTGATCPDQICVKHPTIEKSGELIVCLPNEVVVEIKSNEGKEEIDSVVQ